jgi:hypothetical protein
MARGSYHAKSLRPGLQRARSPGRRRSRRNGCDPFCRGELRGLWRSLRKRLSPSLLLAPLVIVGSRGARSSPTHPITRRHDSPRIRRPRKLRCDRRAPYAFGPGLSGHVPKPPSHAACAAACHARPRAASSRAFRQRFRDYPADVGPGYTGSRLYMTKLEAPRLFLGITWEPRATDAKNSPLRAFAGPQSRG